MDNNTQSESFYFLSQVPEGKYPCSKWYQFWKFSGWLTVEKEDNLTVITWTSGKTVHNRLTRNATIIEVDNSGKLVAFYESIITLCLRYGYGKTDEKQRKRAIKEAAEFTEILKNNKDACK